MYGSSTRTLAKMAECKPYATERRFLCRICGFEWIDKIRNTELYAEVRKIMHREGNNAEVSKLPDVVNKERPKLLGHIMRRTKDS
ncbi:hypothetical protein AB6A40_006433 [Gnathostoma spinigerum]|uniref:Uncharacterized protein n=1 Tax=Gnathostoma spinigerum TaxID=75299 RepID=A0ABD6EID1_9BILA